MLEQYSHSTGEILSQQHDLKAEFQSFENSSRFVLSLWFRFVTSQSTNYRKENATSAYRHKLRHTCHSEVSADTRIPHDR